MAITYKDINLLTQKGAVAGTEKLPVSDTEYITPNQISALGVTKVETTIPVGGMLPNVFYSLGTISSATTMTMAAASDNSIYNEWMFQFATGSSAPTITWDNKITAWFGGSAPTINASKTYQVSVVDGLGVIAEF